MLYKITGSFERFRKDEKGTFGIMAAVTSLMMVMSVGVAIELTKIQAVQAKVQNMTDNLGLMAAVYMRDNENPPATSEEGFVEGVAYTAKQVNAGQDLPGVTGAFTIDYDTVQGRAIAKFEGKVATSFMAAFHKNAVPLVTKSNVKFRTFSKSAISVALIVDNSGSMEWDDKPIIDGSRQTGAVKRIEALKSTAVKFNQNLVENLVETQANSSERFLRLGLIPYNTDVIGNETQEIDWGELNVDDIKNMGAGGGTDTRGPMKLAKKWMSLENAYHKAESGEPVKKYVVLMSDGSNNGEWVCDWQERHGTTIWREWNGFRHNYVRSYRSPGTNWEEGSAYNCKYKDLSNSQSLETCAALRKENVEIFTIGFALEAGTYYSDFPSTGKVKISKSTTNKAYAFLRACASSKENFIEAKNAKALDNAFDAIGKKIIEDNIRIEGGR